MEAVEILFYFHTIYKNPLREVGRFRLVMTQWLVHDESGTAVSNTAVFSDGIPTIMDFNFRHRSRAGLHCWPIATPRNLSFTVMIVWITELSGKKQSTAWALIMPIVTTLCLVKLCRSLLVNKFRGLLLIYQEIPTIRCSIRKSSSMKVGWRYMSNVPT